MRSWVKLEWWRVINLPRVGPAVFLNNYCGSFLGYVLLPTLRVELSVDVFEICKVSCNGINVPHKARDSSFLNKNSRTLKDKAQGKLQKKLEEKGSKGDEKLGVILYKTFVKHTYDFIRKDMASHHEKGLTSKKSTRLVNNTHVKLHLYYVSSNGNPYFRKTLYPRPEGNNDASVDVSTDTRVTVTVNDGVELRDGHTFIEEFDSNNTFGMLRLWDEKCPVVALDTDQLIDNREITITYSDDGNFTPKFTGRSQEKQPKDAELFPGESSARSGSTPSGNFNFFDKVKQYASNRIRSFHPTKPNDG